jgi:hypothetical protein
MRDQKDLQQIAEAYENMRYPEYKGYKYKMTNVRSHDEFRINVQIFINGVWETVASDVLDEEAAFHYLDEYINNLETAS